MGPSADANGLMDNPREYAASRQPGPGHSLAELDCPPQRDRAGYDQAAPCRRGDPGSVAPPAATGPGARHPRSALGWAAGCPPDGRLARGRVPALGVDYRRRGRLLDQHLAVWRSVFARVAGELRRRGLQLRRCLARAEGVSARWPDVVVRWQLGAPGLGPQDRALRVRLQSARADVRTRRWPLSPTLCGPPAAIQPSSRWSAGCAGRSPTTNRRLSSPTRSMTLFPSSLRRATPRFASSRISSPTTWTPGARCAPRRFDASARSPKRHGGVEAARAAWPRWAASVSHSQIRGQVRVDHRRRNRDRRRRGQAPGRRGRRRHVRRPPPSAAWKRSPRRLETSAAQSSALTSRTKATSLAPSKRPSRPAAGALTSWSTTPAWALRLGRRDRPQRLAPRARRQPHRPVSA